MKKTFLFLAILPSILFAQIGPIQTQEKPYEFIHRIVYLDKKANIYYLHCQSNNQFENKVVRYKIGTTPTQVVQSLTNLYATFANQGEQFDLGPYTLRIEKYWIRFVKKGDLYYTAGDYLLSNIEMRAAMKEFLLNRGADTGKVRIIANTPETGILNVYFEDYDIKADLHLDTDITPILSHEYQFEDELTPEDVCALHNAAADGTLTRCPLLLQLCK